ncbi:TetR/AcrR family transcriptional regulator [Sulfitobacter sp. CW3]|jgi:AcrR family transcriptional regulator|uniref:TetR/AcrR family transcriptional regulator n=1 Tax=unclassified Sulfitobacter TaxID=196795 RepID=UPI0019DE66D8|nr:TetR/AcrR family transcriptional regulator [Sulfitobacter sp. CW3]MBW4961132.1 TetR family transcriptional regulator [Sulfitobacter sp. CW3]NOR32282.1 TetR family transcriptional regulator [Sulfitobacter sp.]|tara:strand:+ start:165457 stop:166128 length:672 start_codon:yes stop_codon:yes gene_type:complete
MIGNNDETAQERKTSWKKNPEAVKENILTIATEEFAAQGLSGANINEIAKRTATSKRMIYYYFGDKEGLYQHVLGRVYSSLRNTEQALNVAGLEPVAALRRLTEATFDSHVSNPHFIRLVMIENIHNAEYIKKSEIIPKLNKAIIDKLTDVCDRGKASGVLRADADPLELHWMISSASFYNVSNRATFSTSFGDRLFTDEGQKKLRRRVVDMILSAVVIGYQP